MRPLVCGARLRSHIVVRRWCDFAPGLLTGSRPCCLVFQDLYAFAVRVLKVRTASQLTHADASSLAVRGAIQMQRDERKCEPSAVEDQAAGED